MPRFRNTVLSVVVALVGLLAISANAALLASEQPAVQAMLDAWAPAGWGANVAQACGPPAWPGLHCDYGDTSVTQILLGNTALNGPIPNNLNLLTNLEVVDLQNANLSGTIPTGMGSLSKLGNLYLNGNQLTGTIPPITNLAAIIDFYVHNNSLSGTIPTGFGALRKLKMLALHLNNLNGTVPADIGDSSTLTEFHAGYNDLTGGIPESFGNLVKLTFLDFGMNENLGGTIPESLGNLINLKLLYLQHCGLTGPLPTGMGNFTQLQLIWLYNNGITLCPPPQWTQTFPQGTCEVGHQAVPSCSSGCAQTWETAGCHTEIDPNCTPFALPVAAPVPQASPDLEAPEFITPDANSTEPDATEPVPVDVPSSGFKIAPALLSTLAFASVAVVLF